MFIAVSGLKYVKQPVDEGTQLHAILLCLVRFLIRATSRKHRIFLEAQKSAVIYLQRRCLS